MKWRGKDEEGAESLSMLRGGYLIEGVHFWSFDMYVD